MPLLLMNALTFQINIYFITYTEFVFYLIFIITNEVEIINIILKWGNWGSELLNILSLITQK